MNDQQIKPGPLKLPPTRNPEHARIARRLQGFTTSDEWLPEGLHPELDELRAEQLRMRGQVAAELASLTASVARFRAEDEAHRTKLRQAQRDGQTGPIEDKRTSPEARQAELAGVDERVWAAAAVLAEKADEVVEWAREHEDEVLAERRGKLVAAEDRVRELRDALARAEAETFLIAQCGPWLMRLADDGAFGRQPVPAATAPPAKFDPARARRMLERPWTRPDAEEQPPVAWLEQEPERDDAIEPLDGEDETGRVSGLTEAPA